MRSTAPLGASSLCILGITALAWPPDAKPQGVIVLQPGSTVEVAIGDGPSPAYALDLRFGEYVQIEIDAEDLETAVVLLGPDGAERLRAEALSVRLGPMMRSVAGFVADASGPHLLQVGSPERPGAAGRLLVTVAEQREASSRDPLRIEAQRIWNEAGRLDDAARGGREAGASRQTALQKYRGALDLLARAGDEAGQAATLGSMGRIWYELVDYAKAGEAHLGSLEHWRAAGRTREEGIALSEIGLVCYARYDYACAQEHYDRALASHRAVRDLFMEGETQNRMAWVRNALGDKRGALEIHQRVLQLRRQAGARSGESTTLNDIGRAQLDLGEVDLAIEALMQSLRLRPPEREPEGAAHVLNRLGMAHRLAGDYQEALDTYRQALELARRVGDAGLQGSLLHNIGALYGTLGDVARERAALQESLKLCREKGLRPCEASNLTRLGTSFLRTREPEASLAYLGEALAVRTATQYAAGEAEVLQAEAEAELMQGAPERAAISIGKSLERYRALEGLRLETAARRTLGSVQMALGAHDDALRTFEEVLQRYRATRDPQGEAHALALTGRLLARRGDLAGARDRMREGLDKAESLRAGLLDVDLRSSYLASLQERYQDLTDVLMALDRADPGQGHAAAALQVSERARARGLLDLVAEARIGIRDDVSPTLVAEERALRRRLGAKAAAQSRLLSGRHSEERATEVEKEIAEILERWRGAAAEIRRASPSFAALTQPEALAAERIQALLDPDTVLLAFAVGESRSWLWAVTPEAVTGHELPPRREIEAAARALVGALTARGRVEALAPGGSATGIDRAPAPREAAEVLGRILLSPVAAPLDGDWREKRLVVVASGALEYVPFAVLTPPGGASVAGAGPPRPGPLIERHEIVRLPSASLIEVLRREAASRPRARRAVAVLADPVFDREDPRVRRRGTGTPPAALSTSADAPATRAGFTRLPFSRMEAEAIASTARGRGVLEALGFDASRRTATSARMADYRILHFATHGVLSTEHPELSGVVLSLLDRGGATQDGFLRMAEIYGLRLSAELVVLSGCQTALGKELRGEGLVGLTRGFMYAGASRVVASLWEVDDLATAELMRRFYRAMFHDGLRPAAALRAAQLELRRKKRWASPFYWAPFVLQGEWR